MTLIQESEQLLASVKIKTASKKVLSRLDVKACLEQARKLAIRAEAGKTVTGGFFSDTLLNSVENFLSLATPFVAIYGDWELTTLLSSLKAWLQKKRMEREAEAAQAASQAQTYNYGYGSDLNFSYTF